MAKKKIGIYTTLESTPNNKVEDLYLIVDKESIVFSVKHKQKNEFVAFEHFVNNVDNTGWHQLVAYLQNNSKLIQGVYGNIFFIWNSTRFVLTKKQIKEYDVLNVYLIVEFQHQQHRLELQKIILYSSFEWSSPKPTN